MKTQDNTTTPTAGKIIQIDEARVRDHLAARRIACPWPHLDAWAAIVSRMLSATGGG